DRADVRRRNQPYHNQSLSLRTLYGRRASPTGACSSTLMAQQLNLTIERRDGVGTTHARALRKDGKIPGILYGHGSNPQAIAFPRRALDEILHRGARTSLITLTMDGKRVDTALL